MTIDLGTKDTVIITGMAILTDDTMITIDLGTTNAMMMIPKPTEIVLIGISNVTVVLLNCRN